MRPCISEFFAREDGVSPDKSIALVWFRQILLSGFCGSNAIKKVRGASKSSMAK
jgi:hypothetical protein